MLSHIWPTWPGIELKGQRQDIRTVLKWYCWIGLGVGESLPAHYFVNSTFIIKFNWYQNFSPVDTKTFWICQSLGHSRVPSPSFYWLWLCGSLQSHIILTMSHWSRELPVCFPSQGTQVQIPRGVLIWNWDSPVSVVLSQLIHFSDFQRTLFNSERQLLAAVQKSFVKILETCQPKERKRVKVIR